jgi:Domain of unknown function (4846)
MPVFPLILLMMLSASCDTNNGKTHVNKEIHDPEPAGFVRFIHLPPGYHRIEAKPGSFAEFLRDTRLKESKTVYLYNGKPKPNQEAQYAVLHMSVGNSDLQQCADAVMRLRAEYFFESKQFNAILFYDNDNKAYHFTAPYSRVNLDKYLLRVFGMCGSASLSKQLKPADSIDDIQPGYVFIRGGFPGHAVIVMDVAQNNAGKKIYMLAQSYMPAQDIHILKNPAATGNSPWYEVNEDELIVTPEYTFKRWELKRW